MNTVGTGSTGDLRDVLREKREHIIARFVSELRQTDLPPPGVSRSLLVDHIPAFLDEMLAELERHRAIRSTHDASDTSATARQHGGQRWSLGYDLEALLREYGVLRHCIFEAARDAGVQPSIDEFEIVAKCLSVGVAQAAAEYVRFRDEQLAEQRANLAFLADAGQLLSSSLDYRSTLRRLTGLVVPRLADWCAIHVEGQTIEEMPIAHVDPMKAELLREVYRRFPLPSDSPHGFAAILRTGTPQLVSDVPADLLQAAAQSPEHLALLRRLDARSWMIVPLKVQEHVFGAIVLVSSESKRRYTEHDLVLATELASRAAGAIDNARLYEQSQRARSRQEAATRAKDEFMAVVSHELRTPLTAVLGWTRALRAGSLPPDKQARALEIIERNAEAQSRLVSDLLDVSRTTGGSMRITLASVDLAEIVDRVVDGTRPAADAKRMRIELELDREHAGMRGDGDRLQQVVWNLVTNAVKFTQRDGWVRIVLRRVVSDLELVVSDNGRGMEASFVPHVFDSFRQFEASTSRQHGGLGIGLSIARNIVELHGGEITASSPGPGRGSTFSVRLPLSSADAAHPAPSKAPPAATTPASGSVLPTGLKHIRVLVVEDEPDSRELIAYILSECGMDVRIASSAADARDQLRLWTPSVIVSDVAMPHEDGYSLIRSIRTLPDQTKRSIPAIALTAFARNEDRTRALVEGFNCHLVKPVEPMALIRAVRELAEV